MSGYVEAGYLVALATLSAYAVSLVGRERTAARRLKSPLATEGAQDEPPRPAAPR